MRAHAQAPEDSARSRIGKDGQMPPAGNLDHAGTPQRWLRRRRIVRQADIAHRVGKCQQIIGRWFRLLLHYEPDHFPTSRCRERLRVLLAQVVTVRFRLARQRTQDSRGVPIGVRQGRGGGTLAPCSRTAARPHVPDGTPRAGSIVGSAAVSYYSAHVSSRRRDRHGRGIRGPLALPNALTMRRAQPPHPANKADFFSEAVNDAVDRVGVQCPDVLVGITFGIEDVPYPWSGDQVPLAAAVEGTADQPGQVVIYRRPLEHRAMSRRGLRILVYRTIVEQLSALTGRSVDEIDPDGAGAEDD
jgi:Zincin-like metallopeptidase